MAYKPPYTVTTEMLKQVAEISRLIGQIEGYKLLVSNVQLRRINKIKSVMSSLAIEGSTLTEGLHAFPQKHFLRLSQPGFTKGRGGWQDKAGRR